MFLIYFFNLSSDVEYATTSFEASILPFVALLDILPTANDPLDILKSLLEPPGPPPIEITPAGAVKYNKLEYTNKEYEVLPMLIPLLKTGKLENVLTPAID